MTTGTEKQPPNTRQTVLMGITASVISLILVMGAVALNRGGADRTQQLVEQPQPPAQDIRPPAPLTVQNPMRSESDGPQDLPQDLSADELLRAYASRRPSSDDSTAMPLASMRPPFAAPPADRADPAPAPSAAPAGPAIAMIDLRPAPNTAAPATPINLQRALRPGTIVPLEFTTTANSDYEGSPWLATVTQDVPRPDGTIALPKGTQIIGSVGSFPSVNQPLQNRVALTAKQAVLADGTIIDLPGAFVVGRDGAGAIKGDTNYHALAQTGGVLAAAALGVGANTAANRDPLSTGSQVALETAQAASAQTRPFAERFLSMRPTVVVMPGDSAQLICTEAIPL